MQNAASDDSSASESGEMVPDLPAEPEPCYEDVWCAPTETQEADGGWVQKCDDGLEVGFGGLCAEPCNANDYPQESACDYGAGEICPQEMPIGSASHCAVACETEEDCPYAWHRCVSGEPFFAQSICMR